MKLSALGASPARWRRAFALALACWCCLGAERPTEDVRLVYEAEPEHVDAIVAVLRERMRDAGEVELRAAGAGRIHVDLPDGADVTALRRRAETRGELEFLLEARAGDWGAADPAQVKRAFLEWRKEHADAPPSSFPMPTAEEGGPAREIVFAIRPGTEAAPEAQVVALVRSDRPEWRFSQVDLKKVSAIVDAVGYPAVGLELSAARGKAFNAFTEAHVRRALAVVLDGEVLTLAQIAEPLFARFQIRGRHPGFEDEEVEHLIRILRSGALPAPLRFVEARAI